MGAPANPTITTLAGTAKRYSVILEISQADLANLNGQSNFLKEVGSATPAGFTNPVRFTLSRIPPVPPS